MYMLTIKYKKINVLVCARKKNHVRGYCIICNQLNYKSLKIIFFNCRKELRYIIYNLLN